MDQKMELADLVEKVAKELHDLRNRPPSTRDPVMQFTECELEMAFAVENTGKGGVKLWVFELGGEHTRTNSNTVRLKFSAAGPSIAFPVQQPGPGPELGRKP